MVWVNLGKSYKKYGKIRDNLIQKRWEKVGFLSKKNREKQGLLSKKVLKSMIFSVKNLGKCGIFT
jgi:hypothetical protein